MYASKRCVLTGPRASKARATADAEKCEVEEDLREQTGDGTADTHSKTSGEVVENQLRLVLRYASSVSDLVRKFHARHSKAQRRTFRKVNKKH
mmetsp:Transcript_51532/g.103364  ORF Transcript_51532/g.103364 Transcript_51532/m.103364 type:complete len:93 (-) Transcript_51532:145-423(-)